jgi:hypothetical protein
MLESKIYFGRVPAQDKSWTPNSFSMQDGVCNSMPDGVCNPVRNVSSLKRCLERRERTGCKPRPANQGFFYLKIN